MRSKLVSQKIITTIIITLLFFLSCGIPSDEEYQILNAPANLSVTTTNSSSSKSISITFWGRNPEPHFIGYIILMSTSDASSTIGAAINLVDSNGNFNSTYYKYVLRSKTSQTHPTLPDSDTNIDAATNNTGWLQIAYDIEEVPPICLNETETEHTEVLSVTYHIAVIAYSYSMNMISVPCNTISVTSSSSP